MPFFQLCEVRVTGDQPSADIMCVAPDVRGFDIDSYGNFVGQDVYFQTPYTGKIVGKVTGLSVLSNGQAILKAKVTDETTKLYVSEGDLTGIVMSKDGELSLCDRAVAKSSTFDYRRLNDGPLAKAFRPAETRHTWSLPKTSSFPTMRPPADATCRNGLSREQTAAIYKASQLATRLTEVVKTYGRKPRVNPNISKSWSGL